MLCEVLVMMGLIFFELRVGSGMENGMSGGGSDGIGDGFATVPHRPQAYGSYYTHIYCEATILLSRTSAVRGNTRMRFVAVKHLCEEVVESENASTGHCHACPRLFYSRHGVTH